MLPLRIESQYFGSIHYIQQITTASSVVIDVHEPFKKMSFRNRTVIVSAHGPLLLTVPLRAGRDQKTPMNEVKICYQQNWPSKHIKAFASCYKRSPFYEYYEEALSELLITEYIYLVDLNMRIISWLSKVIKTDFNVLQTNTKLNYLDPLYLDVRDTSNALNSIQNAANQDYPQVFMDKQPFIPNASILDLLFCMGPASNIYLKDNTL
jgi:hypothetical protein